MTPAARVAAAIAVLDDIIDGAAAEQALTAWARGSRYAGSKDRAAVRDHVFDVLRARRSLGDGDGRALMVALSLREGRDVDHLFSGEGYSAAPLTAEERQRPAPTSDAAVCDVPDWLWPKWQDSLGDEAVAVAKVQQGRADVFLRVNQRRCTVAEATATLGADGIITEAHPTVAGCLRVVANPRRIKTHTAYLEGLVELQDASSQFAIAQVPVPEGGGVLDYCAGGGGKALGFADQHDAKIFAHDIAPQRMADLPARAARAGVQVPCLATDALAADGPFDVVFCDAPCSGSGTWRRTPDAKWRFTQERLAQLMAAQDAVLAGAAPLVTQGGTLAYATCSVLRDENDGAVARFVAQAPDWKIIMRHQLLPSRDGDGFFLAILQRT